MPPDDLRTIFTAARALREQRANASTQIPRFPKNTIFGTEQEETDLSALEEAAAFFEARSRGPIKPGRDEILATMEEIRGEIDGRAKDDVVRLVQERLPAAGRQDIRDALDDPRVVRERPKRGPRPKPKKK